MFGLVEMADDHLWRKRVASGRRGSGFKKKKKNSSDYLGDGEKKVITCKLLIMWDFLVPFCGT